MDDELNAVYRFLFPIGALIRTAGYRYPDALIAWIELFRVNRNLSMRAGMDRRRWPIWMRGRDGPSYAQFKRRVKTASVQTLVASVGEHFAAELPRTHDKAIDGKPLTVGGFSKDPDAKRGHVPDGFARGYRLHALVDAGGAIESWAVTPLNQGEATVARGVLANASLAQTTIRADANYDSNHLYAQVATQGGCFIAPRRKPGTGLGHHPQHADRLRAIAELEGDAQATRSHRRHRNRVEQVFGRLSTFPAGLWALPTSVRRLPRVTRYVNAKIALYHAHLAMTQAPPSRARAA